MTRAEAETYIAQLHGEEKALWDKTMRLFRALSPFQKAGIIRWLEERCRQDEAAYG